MGELKLVLTDSKGKIKSGFKQVRSNLKTSGSKIESFDLKEKDWVVKKS